MFDIRPFLTKNTVQFWLLLLHALSEVPTYRSKKKRRVGSETVWIPCTTMITVRLLPNNYILSVNCGYLYKLSYYISACSVCQTS